MTQMDGDATPTRIVITITFLRMCSATAEGIRNHWRGIESTQLGTFRHVKLGLETNIGTGQSIINSFNASEKHKAVTKATINRITSE